MKKLFCLVMVLALLCASAMAEVVTTGNVNLRTGPGLDYDIVTAVPPGESLEFAGQVSVDDRGVEWYLIVYGNQQCWISSRYSELVGEELPMMAPTGEGVEISGYFKQDLIEAANALDLPNYEVVDAEFTNRFYNHALDLYGIESVEGISLYGSGYALFGCEVGMYMDEVAERMDAAGLIRMPGSDGACVYGHPATELSFSNIDGCDSNIVITYDENNMVTCFDWSAYTG